MSRGRSVFGPIVLIGLGVLLLAHNLVGGFSVWTPILDHWPWFLVAWGVVHVVHQLAARAAGSARPRPLSAGALIVALLICLAGASGRSLRDNDGVLFRGFGVRVQVRDAAFRTPASPPKPPPSAPNESP